MSSALATTPRTLHGRVARRMTHGYDVALIESIGNKLAEAAEKVAAYELVSQDVESNAIVAHTLHDCGGDEKRVEVSCSQKPIEHLRSCQRF